MTHQSIKLYGRQLQIMCLNWQMQTMIVIICELEFFISTKHDGSC